MFVPTINWRLIGGIVLALALAIATAGGVKSCREKQVVKQRQQVVQQHEANKALAFREQLAAVRDSAYAAGLRAGQTISINQSTRRLDSLRRHRPARIVLPKHPPRL